MSSSQQAAVITTNNITRGELSVEQRARALGLFESEYHSFARVLESVLTRGAIIAGGAAVYILADHVPLRVVEDIDVFIPNSDFALFEQCARDVDAEFERAHIERSFYVQKSAIKIMLASSVSDCIREHVVPVQFVLSSLSAENIIRAFDFDYVQCAICSRDSFMMTDIARVAHISREVNYIIDDKHNPARLVSRLAKAQMKGFAIPCANTRVCDLGVRIYRPRVCVNDDSWESELHTRACPCRQHPVFARSEFTERDAEKAKYDSSLFLTLGDALKEKPIVAIVNRADYDDEERTELPRTATKIIKESIRPMSFRYVRLIAANAEEHCSRLESRIASLRKREEIADKEGNREEANKFFFHARALELAAQGKFREAITSAISDSSKIHTREFTCEERRAFDFGQGAEMFAWARNGGAKSCGVTVSAIDRLFS